MTSLELIQKKINSTNLDMLIDTIYHNLYIAKSPRNLSIFRSKSALSKEKIKGYIEDIVNLNDHYNLQNKTSSYCRLLQNLSITMLSMLLSLVSIHIEILFSTNILICSKSVLTISGLGYQDIASFNTLIVSDTSIELESFQHL